MTHCASHLRQQMAGAFGGKSPDKAAWDALVRLALETLFDAFRDIKMVRGAYIDDQLVDDASPHLH